VNVAVTLVSEVVATVQGTVPGHDGSLQPTKVEPVPGVAVKITVCVGSNSCEQVSAQVIPAGELVTVPEPATVT